MLFSIQGIVDALAAGSGASFAVVLPDGSRCRTGDGEPRFTITFRSEAALLHGFTRGHIGLLEAWFDGDLDVDGDLGALFAAGMLSSIGQQPKAVARVENDLLEWRRSNRSVVRAKDNARFHYGLGAPFYRLWLDDPLMMYTCAYWSEGTRSLEQAQRNKIDHVIRKIRLSPGERFVDIGCGFGGFMFRALETVGAGGTGVNTATEQVDWLREEIARRGLDDRLTVREADFREVEGQYDKVVSIGVLEHAGRDQLAEVVRAHADFLKPGGLGMLHFIGHVGRYDTELFIRKHVFPGGWIPSLAD
ncbi:MAG: class I SAM-dependent methyltransferase, partial [Burkholderiaceae bacterium]|nr:class I SAM-dependent methyltransferase [Burkholderiaceae bacterium]